MLTDFRYFKVNIGADINPFVHRNYPGFFKRAKMKILFFFHFFSPECEFIPTTNHQLYCTPIGKVWMERGEGSLNYMQAVRSPLYPPIQPLPAFQARVTPGV